MAALRPAIEPQVPTRPSKPTASVTQIHAGVFIDARRRAVEPGEGDDHERPMIHHGRPQMTALNAEALQWCEALHRLASTGGIVDAADRPGVMPANATFTTPKACTHVPETR